MTVVTLLGDAASLGMGQGALLFLARHREPAIRRAILRTLLGVAAPIASVIAVIAALAADPIGGLVGDPSLGGELRYAAPAIALWGLLWIGLGALQGAGAVIGYALVLEVLVPAALLAGGLTALLGGWGLPGVLTAVIVAPAIGLLTAGVLLIRRLPSAPRRALPIGDLTRGGLLRYSAAAGGVITLVRLAWLIDIPLLALLGNIADAGAFRVVLALALPLTLLPNALAAVLRPRIAALLGSGDQTTLWPLLEQATRALAAGCMMLALAVVGLAEPLLGLFGEEFQGAAPALVIAVLGLLPLQVTWIAGDLIPMSGRSGLDLLNNLGLIGVHLAVGIALVPALGTTGAAIAGATSGGLLGLWRLLLIGRLFRFNPLSARTGWLLAIGLGLIGASLALPPLAAPLMVCGYGVLAWRLADFARLRESRR